MERIPHELREKLAQAGYDSVEAFPNVASRSEWSHVQVDCGFTNPQLNKVINALFPAPNPSGISLFITNSVSFFYLTRCFH